MRLNINKDSNPIVRRVHMVEMLKINKSYVYDAKYYPENSDQIFRHPYRFIIGLYFPPELYPAVNGIFPMITVYINEIKICNFQLDGRAKIYKPIADIFWYPGNCLKWCRLRLDNGNRPFWTIEIEDSFKFGGENPNAVGPDMVMIFPDETFFIVR